MPLRKLEPSFHERLWGTRNLEPWFPDAAPRPGRVPIGEVWFETPEVPLLVKFLFAKENLSVQVHPDDEYARFHHNSPGKTEMWHVLSGRARRENRRRIPRAGDSASRSAPPHSTADRGSARVVRSPSPATLFSSPPGRCTRSARD